MNALALLPAFPAYAASVIVLGLNLIGLANASALTRAQAGQVINPEDKPKGKDSEIVFEGGNDRTARYRRAHRNALENTPWFMTTAFVATLAGVSATVGWALFLPYAVFRVLHSVCYVKAIQPFRTVFFVLGLLCQLGVLGIIGWTAFGR